LEKTEILSNYDLHCKFPTVEICRKLTAACQKVAISCPADFLNLWRRRFVWCYASMR